MIPQLHHHKRFADQKTVFLGEDSEYLVAKTGCVLVETHHMYQIYLAKVVICCQFSLSLTVLVESNPCFINNVSSEISRILFMFRNWYDVTEINYRG